jgi:hypothetical protein
MLASLFPREIVNLEQARVGHPPEAGRETFLHCLEASIAASLEHRKIRRRQALREAWEQLPEEEEVAGPNASVVFLLAHV